MDLDELTPEQKLQKYSSFNPEAISSNSFVDYVSNNSDNADNESDKPKDPISPYISSKLKEKNHVLYAPTSNQFDLGNTKFSLDKNKNLKMEEVDKGQLDIKGVEPYRDKMPNLKTIAPKQKEVIDSIDNTKFDPEMKKYLKLLAYRESDYDPTAKNQFGYVGLYQFGKEALDWTGIKKSDYLSNINTQHEAAAKLGELNFKGLEDYVGRTIDGIRMTKSGLMAAAHLGGRGNLLKFIKSDGKDIFKDGNGLPITSYLKYFG